MPTRACLAVLVVAACGDPRGRSISPDAAPEPYTDLEVAGSYFTEERWDLSEPLDEHPELGDAVADLAIELIVAQLGLPDVLDTAAELVLRGLLGSAIEGVVNATFPAELGPGGRFVADLRQVMSDLEVHTTLVLTPLDLDGDDDDPNFFTGTEIWEPVVLREGDAEIAIPVGGVEFAAESYLTVYPNDVTVGSHAQIPYGALIAGAAGHLLGVEDIEAYAAEAAAALDCQAVAAAIGDIQATVDDFGSAADDVEVWLDQAAGVILAGCADLEDQVGEIVVPLLGTTMRVNRSCVSPLLDEDGDGLVDGFEPAPDTQPRVLHSIIGGSTDGVYADVTFVATRVADSP